ncbi:MAG: adenylate cyclase [Cellvibrionaceae bacterium]|jgi:adenylate cyclase
MPKEIERKFLIDLSAIGALDNGINIKQGYIATNGKTVVRARVAGDKAFLTLKGENKGITRSEFEYEIAVEDANNIITELCNGPVVEKIRYLVAHAGHTWEVDLFYGDNEGLALAEIELGSEDEAFEIPSWVTQEVSVDPKYYNSNLLDKPFKSWR